MLRAIAIGLVQVLAVLCAVVVVCSVPAANAAFSPANANTAAAATPPAAAVRHRATLTREAHRQWGLGAPVALFAAQVHAESGWAEGAVSRVGAVGLAQFMPSTALWWCKTQGTPEACTPSNPTWALRALLGYDHYLYTRLARAGPEPARHWAALRSYNGGLGHWLNEYQRAAINSAPAPPGLPAIDAACGSASRAAQHCPENLNYPRRIFALQARYSAWGAMVPWPAGVTP
jgi:soluble lytic murein transglycosylase-like protein